MLEVILEGRILYVLMGIVAAVGILSKIAVNLSLKRLVWAAGNMNKSNHPLMRLVKAKFEHACMVSDTVENVGVFVDKYLYEYRVLGMKLHTLRRLEKAAAADADIPPRSSDKRLRVMRIISLIAAVLMMVGAVAPSLVNILFG